MRSIQPADVGVKLDKLRKQPPLVHNITNYVVMNSTANVLLALGASPVMAHAVEEMEEMVALAQSLVLNIGTLSAPWVEAMFKAGRAAAQKGIPIILDPVGAGATSYRTRTAKRLLRELPITVLRGNAGEVMACGGIEGRTRGVDSLADPQEAIELAQTIARDLKIVVAMTGKTDIVTDGSVTYLVRNGHEMMSRVTGTGCAASAVVGAFCGAGTDVLSDTAAALAFFGFAGECAAVRCSGPGAFGSSLLDELYKLGPLDLPGGIHIEEAE